MASLLVVHHSPTPTVQRLTDAVVAGAQERNRRLLDQLGKDELAVLLDQIDRLTDTAARMLADEKHLN